MSTVKQRLREAAAQFQAQQAEQTADPLLQQRAFGREDELWRVQNALYAKYVTWQCVKQPEAAGAGAGASASTEPVKKYKWATSLDNAPTFDPATTIPRENLLDIGWGPNVTAVKRSAGGSLGVFFVNTDKGTVVLKGSRSLAAEAFASLLAAKLRIAVPRWRILQSSSFEGMVMAARLGTLDPMQHASTFLTSQVFAFVNSFVPGKTLAQFTEQESHNLFGSHSNLTENGRSILRQIGHLIALDVLLNNGDRMPLLWQNPGNAGNIMITHTTEGIKVYSIDTQICPISDEFDKQLDSYHGKVVELLKAVTQIGTTAEVPEFSHVRDRLKSLLHLDVGFEGCLAIQAGFLDILKQSQENDLERDELEKWVDMLRSVDGGLVGIDACKVDFVLDVWQMFRTYGRP